MDGVLMLLAELGVMLGVVIGGGALLLMVDAEPVRTISMYHRKEKKRMLGNFRLMMDQLPRYDEPEDHGPPRGRDLAGLVLIGLFAACIVLSLTVQGWLFTLLSAFTFLGGVLLLSGLGRK